MTAKNARSNRSAPRRKKVRRAASVAKANDPALEMRGRIRAAILKIPRGYVSTYGAVGCAAGYAQAARQVAGVLHRSGGLPWHRVLGSGGAIKLQGDYAVEQRLRLEAEGVIFRGRRVNMAKHEFKFSRKVSPRKKSS
ncbi:MAG TPA: MGMT family protein [Terriglobales bacterium]|nr:MGMT family protein [Terriglobales bacterium]